MEEWHAIVEMTKAEVPQREIAKNDAPVIG